jgi:Forkhead domain
MLNLIPYEARQMLSFRTSFDSSKLSGMTYSYATVQDYRTDHEQKCSAPIPSNHCDGGSPTSTTGDVKPFHLNAFQQDRPRTAFEDSRRTHQLLNAEQSYLDSDAIQSSAYYLEDGFHALEQPPFSSTSNFETTHHGLYQNPYSNSLTPASESHSPIVALPKTQDNMVERSSCREGTFLGREDLEEDDMNSDKPYARLIWEALMQAPGHRLMLREIYSWFECNTNKAIESGSNGWQNSVRHNLSMNQVCTPHHCCRTLSSKSLSSCLGI